MSRIGKAPIILPAGVTVEISDSEVKVKGPKGELTQGRIPGIGVSQQDNTVVCTRTNEGRQTRSYHGLMRALLANMVTGVVKGFSKDLEIRGVGYRAKVSGNKLVLNLGYSHPIEFEIPKGIQIEAGKKNNISVKGIDKQQVGQVAANIRAFRKPDHYKGKGIRYVDEYVRLKAGKTA